MRIDRDWLVTEDVPWAHEFTVPLKRPFNNLPVLPG